ncbi:MAG: ThiF family adenylyltransferase [Flavobacteriales bacterium]|nr:ThiF family adenylyltransferase [Flavobacteriales bacterium]
MSNTISVAVIGAGALGCALLPRLARMRISQLRVIDGDRVELKNLEHQPLYAEVDIGHSKVGTMRGWLQMVDPGKEILAEDSFLDASNANELLKGADIVADCTDDLHAKSLIDRACANLRIPLISGAVHDVQGQIIVLHAPGANEPLGRDHLFRGRVNAEQDGCDMQRVPLETIEAVGHRMAAIIRAFIQGSPLINGRIEMFDRAQWTVTEAPR